MCAHALPDYSSIVIVKVHYSARRMNTKTRYERGHYAIIID